MSKRCLGCMGIINDQDTVCSKCGYVEGTLAKEAYHLPPGCVLRKRFLVGRVLGFGGFGVTYIGYDQVLNIVVAIKEYLPSEFSTRVPGQTMVTIYSGEREEQFLAGKDKMLEEARRLAAFQDVGGIVSIYDSFEENRTVYLIMEFLEGETLKKKLLREKKLSLDESLRITNEVLSALESVHQKGIIHRDVAPDNIYLTKSGQVKILDFGAARYATSKHSRSLSLMVKPGYTPEEQYQSHGRQGPWTDVYAVAATCYHMITGIVPEDSMERGIKDELKSPLKLGIKIPKSVSRALMNALNIKVEDRTQSAKEFKAELAAAQVKVKKSTRKGPDLMKWPLWLKILVGIGLAGVMVFLGLLAANVIQFDVSSWSQASVEEGMVRVPSFVNDTQLEALKKGEELGLQVKTKDKEYSAQVPEGRVLRQSPEAGQVVSKEEIISITLSAGIEQTFVPDFTGYSRERAEELALESGLVAEFEEVEGTMAPGAIQAQSLAPETVLDTGSQIVLKVSKGKEQTGVGSSVVIPDLEGEDFEGLSDTVFSKYGLYLMKEEAVFSDSIPSGQVIKQLPEAGTETEYLGVLTLTVSMGPKKAILPDVEYIPGQEARKLLEDSGFKVEETSEYSDTVEAGSVIKQSEDGNQLVRLGSEVILTLSLGPQPETQESESQPDVTQNQRNQNNQTNQRNQNNNQNIAPVQQPIEAPVQQPIEAPIQAPAEAPTEAPTTAAPETTARSEEQERFDNILDFQNLFQ